jgi:hypothetical protein
MKLVIDFYFLSMCVQLYMFRAPSAHHQDSLTVYTGCMYDEGLLMMRAWRLKHVEFYTYR